MMIRQSNRMYIRRLTSAVRYNPTVSSAVSPQQQQQQRHLHSTPIPHDDTNQPPAEATKEPKEPDIDINKMYARDYNNRRAAYNRQVKELRKGYAAEIAAVQAAQAAAAEEERARVTRRRLERQRRKNERSAANAVRQEQFRIDQAKAFQEHLEQQQLKRDAMKERMRAARQLVVNELEKEAPLWLTTVEEVEKAFNDPDVTQQLWARPGGLLGAPAPSIDAHFWKYEIHTPNYSARTYKSRREVLLEDVEELVYQEANVDPKFWTPERTAMQERRERRARLRAMVQAAGQAALLERQRELMAAAAARNDEDGVPKQQPAPSRKVLANARALEKEGVSILMDRPEEFFDFGEGETGGAPTRLKDHLRDPNGGVVFPRVIGAFDPDYQKAASKEKKQAQRQERLQAAANKGQQKTQNEEKEPEVLDDDFEDQFDDVDYNSNHKSAEDEEWEKGLNPITDARILSVPKDRRFTPEDIEWVLEKLEKKLDHHKLQLSQTLSSMQLDFVSGRYERAAVDEEKKDEPSAADSIEEALSKLPEDQLFKLSDLDQRYSLSPDIPAEDLDKAIAEIPDLTREQILLVLGRDRSVV